MGTRRSRGVIFAAGCGLLGVLGVESGCDRSSKATPTPAPSSNATANPPTTGAGDAGTESIGMATMEPDGTIVLQLRATGPGGMVGDGLLRYPPSHAQYKNIFRHLGGIRPGEAKPVAPFP